MKRKKVPAGTFFCYRESDMGLFLATFLSHKISPTKSSQHSDTAAKRNSVLVALLIVVGQTGQHTVAVISCTIIFSVFDHCTAIEEAATIGVGKSRHAKSENDCYS